METKSILIVTDAYIPQLNGVATTIENTVKELKKLNWNVEVIHPEYFEQTIMIQKSTKISVPLFSYNRLRDLIVEFEGYVHISTEGPLGIAARIACENNNISYTTSFHTKFPEYARIHYKIPEGMTWAYFKWFHKNSRAVLTNSKIIVKDLEDHGISNVKVWSKGVDKDIFKPFEHNKTQQRLVYSGRISKEKNIEAFLDIKTPHTKVVVGDGPQLELYREKYPDVIFEGALSQTELSNVLSICSVFVFPSITDTFGLVMIEAMACGLPVACLTSDASDNLIVNGWNGWACNDLEESIKHCLKIKSKGPLECSNLYSWKNATRQFIEGIQS